MENEDLCLGESKEEEVLPRGTVCVHAALLHMTKEQGMIKVRVS